MKFEFEYRYYGYDKSSILNKIKKLGFKKKFNIIKGLKKIIQ